MCVSNFQGNLSLNGPYNHSIAPGNHYEFSVVLYVKVDIPEISQTDAAHFFHPAINNRYYRWNALVTSNAVMITCVRHMVAKIDLMSFRPISPMILAVFLHSWINIASDNRHIISGSIYYISLLTLLTQSQKRFQKMLLRVLSFFTEKWWKSCWPLFSRYTYLTSTFDLDLKVLKSFDKC